MGKIISFANQKGGVGKTTSAVNVAASLGILGYKTLLVDLDPQGSATSGVGVVKKGLKNSTTDLLTTDIDPERCIVSTEYKGLDIVPCTVSLAAAEFKLYELEESEFRLKKALTKIKDKYDYIIIDCPPSLGLLTVNGMTACDGVIIPMQCEFYALEGLSQLLVTLSRIKEHFNSKLNITGILITMYNGRLLLSAQVISELKKHYPDKLFMNCISRSVKITEAPSFGCPVYYHSKSSKGSKEYLAVAKELSMRI
ncbi:MAG: ParA family protein [Clostridia bacterium]|nr:ParA family protein [Clostridia bacterium]